MINDTSIRNEASHNRATTNSDRSSSYADPFVQQQPTNLRSIDVKINNPEQEHEQIRRSRLFDNSSTSSKNLMNEDQTTILESSILVPNEPNSLQPQRIKKNHHLVPAQSSFDTKEFDREASSPQQHTQQEKQEFTLPRHCHSVPKKNRKRKTGGDPPKSEKKQPLNIESNLEQSSIDTNGNIDKKSRNRGKKDESLSHPMQASHSVKEQEDLYLNKSYLEIMHENRNQRIKMDEIYRRRQHSSSPIGRKKDAENTYGHVNADHEKMNEGNERYPSRPWSELTVGQAEVLFNQIYSGLNKPNGGQISNIYSKQ